MIGTYISDDTGAKSCARFELMPSVSTSTASFSSAISGPKRVSSARGSLYSKGVAENHFSSRSSLRTINEEHRSHRSLSAIQRSSRTSLDTIPDDESYKGSLMLNRGDIHTSNTRSTIYSNFNNNTIEGSCRSLKKYSASRTSVKSTDSDEDEIKIEVD